MILAFERSLGILPTLGIVAGVAVWCARIERKEVRMHRKQRLQKAASARNYYRNGEGTR